MSSYNKIYFENLNGLRFYCFLSVFFYHSFHTEIESIKSNDIYIFLTKILFKNGNLGVNCFFVLSGFLITYLLLIEKTKYSNIKIWKFWVRRILRIWPLFYFCVFFGFIVFPEIKLAFNQMPNESASYISYIFFINNFDILKNGFPDASILGVLWSVAVEEQFYFIWPLIIYALPIRLFWLPFLLIIFQTIVFRFFNINSLEQLEYHSLSCIGDMAIGGLGAWLIFQKSKIKEYITNFSKIKIFIIYSFLFFIYFFRKNICSFSNFILVIERTFIAIIFLFVILEQNYSRNSLFKFSKQKAFSKLGKITYGLYCLHFIGILISLQITKFWGLNNKFWHVVFLETTLALIISIIISYLSYQFYEKPFLKLKEKFQN